MQTYVAFVECRGDGAYVIHVPDVPGFTAGGVADLAEAMRLADEAFAAHLAAIARHGAAAPRARPFAEVMADPALAIEREAAIHIAALPCPGPPHGLD